MKPHRREFLQILAAGAAALGARRAALAQGPTAIKLTDKITLISGAGNNVVSLAGDNGALLVDSGDADHAQDVLRIAGRVNTVINTHWHPESTGGNDALAKSGAKLMAHMNTRLWMTQEVIHDWEKKTYVPRAKEALPAGFYDAGGKLTFAGETVEYSLMPLAHTDGDLYVHFPQSNVLVVGEAVQAGRLPVLDWFCGGWIGGMQAAHRTILQVAKDDTRIVAASGPVLTKAQVQANLDVLTKVREKLVGLMKQGKGAQDWIDAKAVQEFSGQLSGDQEQFLYIAYRGMWAHARELGGIV